MENFIFCAAIQPTYPNIKQLYNTIWHFGFTSLFEKLSKFSSGLILIKFRQNVVY